MVARPWPRAGKKAFTLLAPVAADTATAGTMVSPLSTLVAQQMIAGGLSSTQATQAVRSQLGLPTSGSLNIDFKADSSQQSLAVLANVAAVALGELQAAVAAGAPAGSTAQQKLVASLNELSQSIGQLKAVLGVDSASTAAVSATLVQQAIQATVVALTANASQSIAVAQGSIAGTTTTLDALLAQGFGDLDDWNGACAPGAVGLHRVCQRAPHAGRQRHLARRVLAIHERPLRSSERRPRATTAGRSPTAGGWLIRTAGPTPHRLTAASLVTGDNFGTAGAIGRVRLQEVAGLPMSVVGEVGATASRTFPAGAQASWWSFFTSADSYRLNSMPANGQTTLADFVNTVQTPATGQALGTTWGWNGLEFTFDGALANTGVVSFWSRGSGAAMGKGQYELRTVKGQQVLVVTQVPPAALTDAATRDSNILGEYGNRTRPIFGVRAGAVYSGTTTSAGSIIDANPSLNKVGLNAVLAARGLCQLPDAGGNSVCP